MSITRIDLSRARTFAAPQRPARWTQIEPVRKGAPGLATCVFLLTLGLVVLFATGAWPFVKAWLLGWL